MGDSNAPDLATLQIDPGFGYTPVTLGAVLPWLIIAGVVIYGIGARRNRPKKSRKAPRSPIVVSRGIGTLAGTLAGLGLLGLGGLAVYGISKASSGGQP